MRATLTKKSVLRRLKDFSDDALFILLSTGLFFLVSTFIQIKTGYPHIDIHFRYALLSFISLIGGPVAGGCTGLFGHLLGQAYKHNSLISGWILGSGILGFLQGYAISRSIDKDATLAGTWVPLRTRFEKIRHVLSRRKFHAYYIAIVVITNFVVWPLMVPVLEVILNGADFKTQMINGFYAALSDSLVSIVVTELYIFALNYKIFRRIITIVLTINSLLIFSYARKDSGALILYGITLLYIFYYILTDVITYGLGGKPMKMFRHLFIIVIGLWAALTIYIGINAYVRPCHGDEQAVIVLGAGLNGEEPSTLLACRLDKAFNYVQKHPDIMVVVSGGQGSDEVISEAQAMKNYLVRKGLPEEQILMEDRSTTTMENFRYSATIMQENGLDITQPVAYCTNDFHCFRAGLYAEKEGYTQIRTLPAPTPSTGLILNYLREGPALIKYMFTY